MCDVLGHVPATFASAETARDLAAAAYRQAAQLTPFGTPLVGVGCTCGLTTGRERRGEDKVSRGPLSVGWDLYFVTINVYLQRQG
jgi:hypothetical protein